MYNRYQQPYDLDLREDIDLAGLVTFSGAGLDKLVKESKILAGLNQQPTETHWQKALNKINPQYKNPRMKELLKSYINLIAQGNVQSASEAESCFFESLLK